MKGEGFGIFVILLSLTAHLITAASVVEVLDDGNGDGAKESTHVKQYKGRGPHRETGSNAGMDQGHPDETGTMRPCKFFRIFLVDLRPSLHSS